MVLGHLQSLKKVKKPICFSTPVACSGLHLITSLKGTVSESFEGIEPKPASSTGGVNSGCTIGPEVCSD